MFGTRITVEHARGPRRDGGRRDGDRRRAMWVDKYGPPTRTKYRMVVENLSTKMSWQVGNPSEFNMETYFRRSFLLDFHSTGNISNTLGSPENKNEIQ